MSPGMIHTLYLACCFLALFGIGELLYHKASWKAEATRKIVHIGTGLLALTFPVLLADHRYVLLLCSSFLVLLLLSIRWRLLPSINAIGRKSAGSLAYPFAVYGCYLVFDYYNHQYIYYYLPILILGLCDPAAAFAGKKFPAGKYSIRSESKTAMGSLTFFVTATILSFAFFAATTPSFSDGYVILKCLIIALLAAFAEAVSSKGYDNITIPAAVLAGLAICNQLYL